MKTVIIIEDSSRVGFGGGQKMTLIVAQMLNKYYHLRFVDFSSVTRFDELVRNKFPKCEFVNIGKTDYYQAHEQSWGKAIRSFIIDGWKNVKEIAKGQDASQCIAYATNKRSLLYACLMNIRYGIPYIYHAHRVENEGKIYQIILKLILRKAKAIVCVSQTVNESIHCNKNKIVLYNPSLNNRGFKFIKEKDTFVVAFIGSLIQIKGTEFFVKAAKLCNNSRIEFRVYGEGKLRGELESLSDGHVRFMGFVQDIIEEEYKEIDLVVVTTITKEALPLVVVDAKSVGLPVIVTATGGQAEIIKDGVDGFHVPMKDAKAIIDKVILLANDKTLYERLSRASFESFKQFDCNLYENRILDIFRKLK